MPPLDGLPGADALVRKRLKSSPAAKVVSHLIGQLRRPTRLHRRAALTALAIAGVISLIIGRRHAYELQRTASTISAYIPHSIADVISHHELAEHIRWDDMNEENNGTEASFKKPKFHLLIPTPNGRSTPKLCKTLLSAAVLNYPPPTLLRYQETAVAIRPGADVVRNVFSFLLGKEAHDDDLILIVGEDGWFQLPAEVLINRFFHGLRASNEVLLKKHGRKNDGDETMKESIDAPKYTQRVLFGARKECSNPPGDPACCSIPQSTLPKDIYGPETDRHPEGKYNRPRFMSSAMVMGRVTDLRPIYKLASELLEFEEIGKHGSQHIFSLIFGQQEYARSLALASKPRWKTWLSSKLQFNKTPNLRPPNMTFVPGKNYEFGIGLDYESSIFQVMNNSAEDVRSMNFSQASGIVSLSGSPITPINLPLDLSLSSLPIPHHNATPISPLDKLPSENLTWSDLELATNIIVPGLSVPAMLSFHGNSSDNVMKPFWRTMWYHPHLRALLRLSLRTPSLPIPADLLWDLRGGKGGIWNEAGEWKEWAELCGGYSDSIFEDKKGVFGEEDLKDGGDKPVFNQWGQLMSGKARVTEDEKLLQEEAEKMQVAEKYLDEQAEKANMEDGAKVVADGIENVKGEFAQGQKEVVIAEVGKSETGKATGKIAEESSYTEEDFREKEIPKVENPKAKDSLAASKNGPGKANPLSEDTNHQSPQASDFQPPQAETNNKVKELSPPSSPKSANLPPFLGRPLPVEGKGDKIEPQTQPPKSLHPDESLPAQFEGGRIQLNGRPSQLPQHTNPEHYDTEDTHTPQSKISTFDRLPQAPDRGAKPLGDAEKVGVGKGAHISQEKTSTFDRLPQRQDTDPKPPAGSEKDGVEKGRRATSAKDSVLGSKRVGRSLLMMMLSGPFEVWVCDGELRGE